MRTVLCRTSYLRITLWHHFKGFHLSFEAKVDSLTQRFPRYRKIIYEDQLLKVNHNYKSFCSAVKEMCTAGGAADPADEWMHDTAARRCGRIIFGKAAAFGGWVPADKNTFWLSYFGKRAANGLLLNTIHIVFSNVISLRLQGRQRWYDSVLGLISVQ